MKCNPLFLVLAIFVFKPGNIQPVAAGGLPDKEVSSYEPRAKIHTHHHHRNRQGSYPPTVMKDGRAYYYYPGTDEQDQPVYSGEPRHAYERQGRNRLFGSFNRLHW